MRTHQITGLSVIDAATISAMVVLAWVGGLLTNAVLPNSAPGNSSWWRMWTLAVLVYALCKAATMRGNLACGTPLRRGLYLLAWPGMDAGSFLTSGKAVPLLPSLRDWLEWTACGLAGVALLMVATALSGTAPGLAAWVAIVGLILALHFGVFGWLSGLFRAYGIHAMPIMNHPTHSQSLSEFWGRRWNAAFRDLSHRFIFRPLSSRCGPQWASFAVFAASGFIHDLVISVPAGGGYGWPTLYFLSQWWGLVIERSAWGRTLGLGRGWVGKVFAAICILLPLSWLAHEPFQAHVILPFLMNERLVP